MKAQRGQVVMVDWAYSDRTGSKRRPALVQKINDCIKAALELQ